MNVPVRCYAGLLVLAMLAAPAAGQPSNPAAANFAISQQRAAVLRSEQIMAAANRRTGLLSQFLYMRDAWSSSGDAAFRVIFNQYVSWYQTWVGDYRAASLAFSIAQPAANDDSASPLLSGFHAEPAIPAVLEMARGRQAIFFNEAHSQVLTRSMLVQVLAGLRAEGYEYFASETLYETDRELAKRGYPTSASGFYTEEPVYAEIVREALRLGFKPVAYEAVSNATGSDRELEQARNLIAATLKNHPKARIVVNAGFAHIQKSGRYFRGVAMAQHFQKLTGIEPLSIEQTMMVPHDKAHSDHPWYTAIIAAERPTQPIVYRNASGAAWSLKSPAYDVSVIFPPEQFDRGRPTWLALGGLRQPYRISGMLCADSYPCLVEARYANEGDDAIPADRFAIEFVGPHSIGGDSVRESSDAAPLASLWLRPGKYRLVSRDISNRIVSRRTITVREGIEEPAS